MHKIELFIAHGALIWKIALPLLTIAVGVLMRWLWRRWSAHKIRRDVARTGALVRDLKRSGRTYLRGTLRDGTLMTCAGPGAVLTYAGNPWLDCGGARVEISAGQARVVHGTRFKTQWWHPIWPRTDRSVVDGDEVIIGGELVFERLWKLRPVSQPSTQGCVHDVRAAKPDLRPGAIGLLCTALVLGAIAGIFYGVMHHVGAKARARLGHTPGRATGTIEDLGDFEIAASMPESSEDLSQLLGETLRDEFPHNEQTFQLRASVLESRGECPFWLNFNVARYDDALELAERCGTREEKRWAYAFDGRFGEAERQLAPDDPELTGTIAIALGHWTEAARAADSVADQHQEGSSSTTRCIAALFRAYSGDAHAFDRLQDLSGSCEVLQALSLPPAEQAAALERAVASGVLHEDYLELAELASAALPQGTYRVLDCCSFGSWRRDLWFMPFIDRAHRADQDDYRRDGIADQLAELDIERGDLDAARRDIDRIADPDNQVKPRYDLELATGEPLTPLRKEFFRSLRSIRNFGVIDRADAFAAAFPEDCVGELRGAAALAAGGDGGWLARVLDECWVSSYDPESWVALLPRVKIHRQELAAALRLQAERFPVRNSDEIPFHLIGELSMRKTISHLVGDKQEARRLQVIIDRHAALLTDPHKLIAFWLWTQREPFR